MKTLLTLTLFNFILFAVIRAQDTFSIIAVDTATREVGSAGATCLTASPSNPKAVKIISGIIPGRGGVNAQAWVCIPNINLQNGLNWMKEGLSPQEVLDSLIAFDQCAAQSYNYQYRQYGIVDFDSSFNARSAAFTGNNADDYKGHTTGYNYAIQGNILLGKFILDSMEARFLREPGTLADKLMAAMQGANVVGADARCTTYNSSSRSAYLRVAKCDDVDPDKLYMEVEVLSVASGVEPIDSLQKLYDQWKINNPAPFAAFKSAADTVCPGDCIDFMNCSVNNATAFSWTFQGAATASSSAKNPANICFNTVGEQTVTLIVSNAFGSDTVSRTIIVDTCPGTGFGQHRIFEKTVIVYPNPASREINFSVNMNQKYRFELINILGETVYNAQFNKSSFNIATNTYPAGVYFYKFATENGMIQTGKLIILH